jgi:hypothetical protein
MLRNDKMEEIVKVPSETFQRLRIQGVMRPLLHPEILRIIEPFTDKREPLPVTWIPENPGVLEFSNPVRPRDLEIFASSAPP